MHLPGSQWVYNLLNVGIWPNNMEKFQSFSDLGIVELEYA